jgi:hypothetical protein
MQTIPPIELEIQPRKPNATICFHNELFTTLLIAVRRLERADHREYLITSLTVMTDRNDLKELSTLALTELLFQCLEEAHTAERILNLQNVLIYSVHKLEGVYDDL